MPYATPLLIRGINNLSDARYCAGMGADKLSFILDPSLPDALAPAVVKELAGWIAGVELIGEFDELSPPEINSLAADCGLDAVLLRRPRPAAELAEIAPPVIVEYTLADMPEAVQALTEASFLPAGLLVELPATDLPADTLAALTFLARQTPLWLGPGLDPARAQHLLTQLQPGGLVFASGYELKPGLRDFDQLEAVFEALEVA